MNNLCSQAERGIIVNKHTMRLTNKRSFRSMGMLDQKAQAIATEHQISPEAS